MKFIFDFDDVLFNNTKQFKEHMYRCLEVAGVRRRIAEEYYKTVRENQFSLKDFISTLLAREKPYIKTEDLYQEIMSQCKNFINVELVEILKKVGRADSYLVSNGEDLFQRDKIKRSEIADLFSEIHVVPDSKKAVIYYLCDRFENERIYFIEDKTKFIDDLDIKKCPNLKTILFDDKGLQNLKAEIDK